MICETCELNYLKTYKYVVIIAKYRDKWILCKHKERNTWETAGGHIELGETPLDAAKRELFEETGAVSFDIKPVFDYWAKDEISRANGMVFYAEINELGNLPESEMEKVKCFETLPSNLTYKDITQKLFQYLESNYWIYIIYLILVLPLIEHEQSYTNMVVEWQNTREHIYPRAISIHHYLNENLLNTGGRIGYGICPAERKKGYAKTILKMAL